MHSGPAPRATRDAAPPNHPAPKRSGPGSAGSSIERDRTTWSRCRRARIRSSRRRQRPSWVRCEPDRRGRAPPGSRQSGHARRPTRRRGRPTAAGHAEASSAGSCTWTGRRSAPDLFECPARGSRPSSQVSSRPISLRRSSTRRPSSSASGRENELPGPRSRSGRRVAVAGSSRATQPVRRRSAGRAPGSGARAPRATRPPARGRPGRPRRHARAYSRAEPDHATRSTAARAQVAASGGHRAYHSMLTGSSSVVRTGSGSPASSGAGARRQAPTATTATTGGCRPRPSRCGRRRRAGTRRATTASPAAGDREPPASCTWDRASRSPARHRPGHVRDLGLGQPGHRASAASASGPARRSGPARPRPRAARLRERPTRPSDRQPLPPGVPAMLPAFSRSRRRRRRRRRRGARVPRRASGQGLGRAADAPQRAAAERDQGSARVRPARRDVRRDVPVVVIGRSASGARRAATSARRPGVRARTG